MKLFNLTNKAMQVVKGKLEIICDRSNNLIMATSNSYMGPCTSCNATCEGSCSGGCIGNCHGQCTDQTTF